MTRGRYTYVPKQTGRISITNIWHERIAYMDCEGDAQQAYEDLCRDLEKAGWELEHRIYDSRYIRRNGLRWYIAIGDSPTEPRDRRGYMALIADFYGGKPGEASQPK